MPLAAILAVCLLGLAFPGAGYPGAFTVKKTQASGSSQTAPAQAPQSQPPSTPAQPAQETADQPKPAPKPRHRKKTNPANCSTAAPAPTSAENSGSSVQSTPCPPPKKVVRNGGSEEPAVQLTGGTTAEQASHERSTNQLMTATEENLKKIEGHQLSPSQQEMVNQIKQFREQSKTAAAAGDLDRAHNLALKAHLLSDELVKP
jgi:hypothetical protein